MPDWGPPFVDRWATLSQAGPAGQPCQDHRPSPGRPARWQSLGTPRRQGDSPMAFTAVAGPGPGVSRLGGPVGVDAPGLGPSDRRWQSPPGRVGQPFQPRYASVPRRSDPSPSASPMPRGSGRPSAPGPPLAGQRIGRSAGPSWDTPWLGTRRRVAAISEPPPPGLTHRRPFIRRPAPDATLGLVDPPRCPLPAPLAAWAAARQLKQRA